MLITSLENALHWQSLIEKAKNGNESALELILKTDKENLEAGDPSVENQLKNMQKDNDGSLISNNGIDWKNRGYKIIPEIDSTTAAVRVLEYYYSMREDKDIPILALILDEQTGRAGYITRIEAFVDLMRRRKRKIQANKEESKNLESVGA